MNTTTPPLANVLVTTPHHITPTPQQVYPS